MDTLSKLLDAINGFIYRVLPFLQSFQKTPEEQKADARIEIEKEASSDKEAGRPSGDFWKNRGL